MANCTYIYNNKKYSRDFLLRKLAIESLENRSQEPSIKWLKDKLGMTDSEIVIIQGLIENKALGRFTEDGNILLSSFADTNTAYHEAFHRVFNLYLSEEERKQMFVEFKKRSNWLELLKPYRELYGNEKEGVSKSFSSTEEMDNYHNKLIEEYLADEFSDYVLNEEYKLDQPTKSIFDRIIDFIKGLLGLNKKDVRRLYRDVATGKYKSTSKVKNPNYSQKEKILIQDYEMSYVEKNEVVDEVSRLMISRIAGVSAKALEDFIQGKNLVNDFQLLRRILEEDILPILEQNNPQLADAIEQDYIHGYETNPSNSIIYTFYKDKLQRMSVNVVSEKEGNEEDIEEYDRQMNDTEIGNSKGEFTSSLEVDPKSNLSKRLKLILSSFVDPNQTTTLGFQKPIQWSQAFLKISETLAGVPSEEAYEVLKQSNLPFREQLILFIDRNDFSSQQFRNDLLSSLNRTVNNFQIAEMRDGELIFYNANNNTKEDKLLREWESGTIKIINELGFNNWKNRVDALLSKNFITLEEIESTFGITLNEEVDYTSLMFNIADTIKRSKFSDSAQPDYTSLFKSLDIYGSVKKLASLQSQYEDATDLMVYAMGKRIYGLGFNTHVTNVLNRIKFAQSKFSPEMSDSEKIELIKQYAPYVVSRFNLTYNEDGSVTIHNPWLTEILKGKELSTVIVYNMQNDIGDQVEVSKLNETDLLALHLNSSLSGVTMSLKHSDRSIFYGYKFEGHDSALINPLPAVGYKSKDEVLTFLSTFIAKQIELEVEVAKFYDDNFIPYQHFGKKYKSPGLGSILGKDRWEQLLSGQKINNSDLKKIKTELVDKYYNKYVEELNKWNVIGKEGLGIGKSNLLTYNNDVDLLVATSFANEVVAHVSEVRLFNNDLRFYSDPTTFFKRLAPISSTGQSLVNDEETNQRIRTETSALRDIKVFNPLTNQVEVVEEYSLAPDGYMRGVTIKENDSYKSHLLDPATNQEGEPLISKLTGKQESKIFMLFESGFLNDNIEKLSNEELIKKIQRYEAAYGKVNENDGQSWMNIIAFKNYMIRLGQWTEGMENVFKVEMQILSARSIEDIFNIEIDIRGKRVKVFEIPRGEQFHERVSSRKVGEDDIVVFEQFHPFHTLKTQYSGYSLSEQYLKESVEQLYDTSIFKTSQHILLPSNIIGTNLSLMNLSMLKNGIDIIHMGSANKVGGIDSQLSGEYYSKQESFKNRRHINTLAERGFEFYDAAGNFNYDLLNENSDILSYLIDVNFLKDQVKIGNRLKSKIKGSTQSLKIIVSNLIVNGRERFPGAQQLLDEYKATINRIVSLNVEELREELDSNGYLFNSKENLRNVLLNSQMSKGAPENILNAIENFIDDPIFEKMPNKQKIENILYSIVTNTAITFNRPGDSYPQAASTGYEKVGTRQIQDNSSRSNQELLRFYDVTFDNEGNVKAVKPAEIIIPLPDYWVEPLLRKYKTRNIAKAIYLVNKDIESGKLNNEVTTKGVRIPNQQLSSNDIFRIKRFGLPTMQAYAIVPTELVVKVGSDMDIDKENLYWNELKDEETLSRTELEYYESYRRTTESLGLEPLSLEAWMSVNGKKSFEAIDTDFLIEQSGLSPISWISSQSKNVLYSHLLKLEKDILLNPRNVHHLFMPVTDDIIASPTTGVYGRIYVNLEGNSAANSADYLNTLMPHTQVANSIIFVGGKFGVGIVALSITGHGVFQTDNVTLNRTYNFFDEVHDTMLRFEGLENNYQLNNYTDESGKIITEFLSQLLTTQVDNVKNPVGIKLGINNQTLNIVEYLVRRGVSPVTAIAFIKQPLIQKYLEAQRINESLANKTNGRELKKDALITKVVSENMDAIPEESLPSTAFINDEKLFNGIKFKKMDDFQYQAFMYFLELINQSRVLSNFTQEQTADTKALKDKSAYEETVELRDKTNFAEIFPEQTLSYVRNQGLLAPFNRAREEYNSNFNGMYITNNPGVKVLFDVKKGLIVRLQKTANKKSKAGTTFENDFILYFAMKYVLPTIDSDYYEKLFGFMNSEESLAARVKEMQEEFPDNLVLKAFLPLLKTRIDAYTGKYLDNIKLFEREINSIDMNDLLNSMKEIAETDFDTYRDLIVFTLMQSGFNNSPFNYLKIIPQGLNKNRGEVEEFLYVLNDIMRDTIIAIEDSVRNGNIQSDIEQYFDEFQRNNPQFLRTKTWKNYPLNYFIGFTKGKMRLFRFNRKDKKARNEVPVLGSTYHKRYGLGNFIYEIQRPREDEEEEYTWARTSENSYEVSTKGDKRFSALVAKLKDGRTIEEAYQLDVKGYRSKGNDWRLGKGKPPLIPMSKEETYNEYKKLWIQWAKENPELMDDLAEKAQGKTLTDVFAKTEISQARVLSELLNEKINKRKASQELQTSEDNVAERVNADFNSLFPQYEYFNEEQKEEMGNLLEENQTPIECKLPGKPGKFGR